MQVQLPILSFFLFLFLIEIYPALIISYYNSPVKRNPTIDLIDSKNVLHIINQSLS